MGAKTELKKLANKKIALLGLGLENRALLAWLKKHKIKATVRIKDVRLNPRDFNRGLEKFDLLFRSPGWPLFCPGIKRARAQGKTEITSALNLFFSLCPTKNIVGVTGSKGKGTTASLIDKILKDAGRHVWLGGNIGVAPFSFLDRLKPKDFVVLELSSFQLEDLEHSPRWAIITNLFKEHLAPADPRNPNFHPDLKSYWQAKLNIARAPENEWLLANKNLRSKLKREKIRGRLIYFAPSSLPAKLVGAYNRENVGAAVRLAKVLKIKAAQYKKTIANFGNLEHRLKLVRELGGVKYFDDSFSTTPESALLDLNSFSQPLILIAGGADKGADFRSLAKSIKKKVKFLLLLTGPATRRLQKELVRIKFPSKNLLVVNGMAAAVKKAREQAQAGDIVLLSPACASFGLFKNYKERGDRFKYYVRH